MPVLTSRPTGIFRITALKASDGQGNMKYCRVRLSLKFSHADAGSGRSDKMAKPAFPLIAKDYSLEFYIVSSMDE